MRTEEGAFSSVATEKLSQKPLRYLSTLDIESKYKEVPPKLSVRDLSISVLSNDNDAIAVKNMFKTLAASVLKNEWNWQCIVLDYANRGIYGGIEGVHEVDEWRNGNKLIPEEWYK
ncbi:DUF3732 domain-containing protein [uncultured Methanolobus sp.]|uniref:DUF3732 domain-containing protein n=1 Tax=uncultured Methanolobus sp. TaxID=218300 RepID=UPI002AAAF433|nr:DUF3732 domain-containing protein [uncultured Methanolobus sp.]